jgi:hypothetical protein
MNFMHVEHSMAMYTILQGTGTDYITRGAIEVTGSEPETLTWEVAF